MADRCETNWYGSADGFQKHRCEKSGGHDGDCQCACGATTMRLPDIEPWDPDVAHQRRIDARVIDKLTGGRDG